MAMCESLHSNSPLPPLKHKYNSYIPRTLNSYITHPILVGPRCLGAHTGVLPDQGKNQLVEHTVICSITASHSYWQKSKKMVTAIIFLTKNRFPHYFHFQHPVLLTATCHHNLCWQEEISSSSSSP